MKSRTIFLFCFLFSSVLQWVTWSTDELSSNEVSRCTRRLLFWLQSGVQVSLLHYWLYFVLFWTPFFFIQTSIPKFCGEEYRDKIRRLLFLCTFIESWTYAGWQGPWEVHIIPKFSYQVRLQYSKTVRVWSSQSGAGLTCLGHSSMAEPSRQGKSFSLTPVWASRVAAHATASHPPNTQHV